ncbi:ParB N-terminal domain-containing protein [Amphritea atlantica]|uniref:ParB N-terminal domain-containing protein n=1 Tax=Amphritea atlantica TaxID=355243 RepID=A0ABY5GWX4_9GAMM|nr:ParB N-terminal domain-containing protein [Amphritea atlantica]
MNETVLKDIPLSDIKTTINNLSLQNRTNGELCADTVADYADKIDTILEERPIEVSELDGDFYLTNGFHRLTAYRAAHPEAETIPAQVKPALTPDVVVLRARSANFDNGVSLTPSERKANVIALAVSLNYGGTCEKAFIEQLHEITKISRPTLKRHTKEIRNTIQWNRTRQIALHRLAGKSQRETADLLGVKKEVVERADKERKEAPFAPLPNDPLTRVGIYNRLIRAASFNISMKDINDASESWCDPLADFDYKDLEHLEDKVNSFHVPRSLPELEELYPRPVTPRDRKFRTDLENLYAVAVLHTEHSYEDWVPDMVHTQLEHRGIIEFVETDYARDEHVRLVETGERVEWDGSNWSVVPRICTSVSNAASELPTQSSKGAALNLDSFRTPAQDFQKKAARDAKTNCYSPVPVAKQITLAAKLAAACSSASTFIDALNHENARGYIPSKSEVDQLIEQLQSYRAQL